MGKIKCKTANGKSNIFGLLENIKDQKILIIADGAAFGPEMEKIMKRICIMQDAYLYLPESFEWLILSSGLLKDNIITEILSEPSRFIDGKEFFSWERFFTHLLIEKTEDSYLKYSKNHLNDAYMQKEIQQKILSTVEKVDFGIN